MNSTKITVKTKNMKKKIFVTGGNGFIGSRLVKSLVDNGYDVKCLLRNTSKVERIKSLNYEAYYGDITNLPSLIEGMKDCSGVIHLASLSNWDDIHSDKMEKVVIDGSKNVIEAAKQNNNLRMVYISSSTAIDGTKDPKVLSEKDKILLDPTRYEEGSGTATDRQLRKAIDSYLPNILRDTLNDR